MYITDLVDLAIPCRTFPNRYETTILALLELQSFQSLFYLDQIVIALLSSRFLYRQGNHHRLQITYWYRLLQDCYADQAENDHDDVLSFSPSRSLHSDDSQDWAYWACGMACRGRNCGGCPRCQSFHLSADEAEDELAEIDRYAAECDLPDALLSPTSDQAAEELEYLIGLE
jgi:hypothetical protein